MPKIVDHDARRADIFKSSFELFAARGYASLTMRELAQALSVSTGTLYHYFDNKRALFQQMFDWIASQDAQAARVEVPAEVPREQRRALLKAFLIGRAEHLTKVLKLAVDFQRHHTPQEAQEAFGGLLRTYLDAIAGQMSVEGREQAQVVLSLIIGVLMHHSFDPERVPLDAQLQRVIQVCAAGGLL
ncbi:MAG: TetR/AcrR family transcriptional regulator [Deltaproteobacteria bacterium]|nr:TetR/AcrR family transcriptional regulator [Deltaproteobacteria bacterium]